MGRTSADVHADPLPTRALRTLGEVLSLCGGISVPTAIQALVTRYGASVDPEEMTLRSLESQLKPGAAFVSGELVLRDLQFSLCTVGDLDELWIPSARCNPRPTNTRYAHQGVKPRAKPAGFGRVDRVTVAT